MRRQLQGIACILFGILLSLSFRAMGIDAFFDLSFSWKVPFVILGALGLWLVFSKERES